MDRQRTIRRTMAWALGVLGCAAVMAWAEPGGPAEPGERAGPVSIEDVTGEAIVAEPGVEITDEASPRKKLLPPTKPVESERSPRAVIAAPAPTPAPAPMLDDTPIPLPPQEDLPLGGTPPLTHLAGSTAPLSGSGAGTDTGTSGWALQTLSALAIVIALIFVLRIVIQRLTGQSPIGPATRIVEVLARTTIAPKTSVILLKVNGAVLVVGHTPSGLSTLATFDEPGDVAQLLSQVSASKPLSITQSFRSVLHGADERYDDDEATAEDAVDRTHDQVSGLLARLRTYAKKDSA